MSARRDEIVEAARLVFLEGGASAVTVRSVASRAGIGASTLRHYFPSQRDLHNAVFTAAFDANLHDLRIRDTTVPPRDRLLECLWQFLEAADSTEAALEAWLEGFASMVRQRATPEMRAAWTAFTRQAQVRTVAWLEILDEEGAMLPGTADRHARMLLALIDGLAVAMLVPETRPTRDQLRETLGDAVATVVTG
ncbi:AcrR family transcriptional regulator [Microbacteriaceae bacterium SG_E_30_P1]|uniref:AcrR family transcriptional regulator n=1 Tax=Antiquaquibacter oligotrophicus TaxID=2880260 RepID=A0ABT6KSX6_9MICO|nr:TetR/AcrR family transcriptional regulator [Antiquaquibacter oligotrophicus]MDH6182274.1 AcrR family transcriptional regulator [Antiquaquibacter oligotrophicus]UDF12069.1 TetR/AcrR family transcriptional regulator [Antiquaquibacter oligotrophicus]